MNAFTLEVVTPGASAHDGSATSLQVPAWEGYLGVLANHAPLLAVLKPGVVTVKNNDKTDFFAIKGGFMEVAENKVVILADDFVAAAKVKRSEAESELEAAEASIGAVKGDTADERAQVREVMLEERELARGWAEAQLKAADMHDDA